MKINEIFCSINGESARGGLRTVFIRTFACNLRCSYCDTMYAVEGSEFHDMSVDDIISAVSKYDCKRVTLTGGEPLLQSDALDLIEKLSKGGYEVEIETNGAVELDSLIALKRDYDAILITMDWKCPTSGMNGKMKYENLRILYEDDVVKYVVGSIEDLEEMKHTIGKTDAQIYVSPVFGKIELKEIAEYIINNKLDNVRFQLQTHKFIWPVDMRGV